MYLYVHKASGERVFHKPREVTFIVNQVIHEGEEAQRVSGFGSCCGFVFSSRELQEKAMRDKWLFPAVGKMIEIPPKGTRACRRCFPRGHNPWLKKRLKRRWMDDVEEVFFEED